MLVAERLELRQRSVVGRLVLHVEVEQEGGGRVAVIVLGRDVQRVVARDVGEVLVGDVDGALRRSRQWHLMLRDRAVVQSLVRSVLC